MTCVQARSGPLIPRYVLLTATGTTVGGTPSRRALRGSYPLQVGAVPVPSPTWGPEYDDRVQPRPIIAWSPSRGGVHLCLDPGAGRPAPGAKVKLQSCDGEDHEDNGYKQFWYYRQDLSIATVGSILATNAMCLDAGPSPAVGVQPTMQKCVTPIPVQQRWYYNAFANIELASSTGPGQDDVALSGMCLNVARPETVGSDLVLGGGANCHSASFSTRQTFSSYTKIGPGQAGSRPLDCTAAAGYPCVLTQLVNSGMPSRCLDKYTSFLANMECVQDPDPTKIRWNQLWRLPQFADGPTGTVGPIVTVDPDGVTYCLTAPANADQPRQESCDPLAPATDQKFTVYRNTGDEFTMYRITDFKNRCLTHPNADTSGPDPTFYWNQASYHWKSSIDRCVNSRHDPYIDDDFNRASVLLRQKWNAPFRASLGSTPADPTPTATPTPKSANVLPLYNLNEVPPA
jgi:hypothetical protein